MIDEHSREDELMVQIIGLQGKIESLKKNLKNSERVLIQKSKLEEIFKALEQAEVQIPYNIIVKINKLLKEVGILR